METPINLPDEHQYSILRRVIDGTLTVDSVDEFKEILTIYPTDPLLQRKFADLLVEKSLLDEAFATFHKASQLFINQGMNLQAIVAKILQWSIQKPNHEDGRQFHKLMNQKKGAQQTPLQRLWVKMSYGELITFMLRLVRVRLSKDDKILCVDEPNDDIFFIVSGTMVENLSPDCQLEASKAGVETEPMLLGPNDIFGNIFPLDQPTLSFTDVVAINDVELVKISKPALHSACQKFPNITNLLLQIYNSGNENKCARSWQTVRRNIRFGVPTKVELIPLNVTASNGDDQHTAIAVDLSVGGVCVYLGPSITVGRQQFTKGQPVRLSLDLLNKIATVDLSGKIVWRRDREVDQPESLLIGIRFDTMKAYDRELLTEYCSESVGEQNLLWGLWDSLVKPNDSDG